MNKLKWIDRKWLEGLPVTSVIETSDKKIYQRVKSGKWVSLSSRGYVATSQEIADNHPIARLVSEIREDLKDETYVPVVRVLEKVLDT